MEQEYNEIDLREILHAILRRWWIILITTVVSVTATASINFLVLEPVYSVHTTLFVGTEGMGLSEDILGISSEMLNINSKLVGDYREIAKSRTVAKEVIRELDLDFSVSEFQDGVQVTSIPDTRIFKITYEDPDPELVTDIVNKLAEVLIQKAKDIVNVDNIQVIDEAEVPALPVKPNKTLNIAISIILGMMLGAFIIFLIEFFDNTIKTPEDVESILGLNVLGTIPTFDGEERR